MMDPSPPPPAQSAQRGALFDGGFLRRLERLTLPARLDAGGAGGAPSARARGLGDSLEFADHRAYSPGDDRRLVDWACYARSRKLLVRRFHRHPSAPLGVWIDASASMGADGGRCFDYARQLAVALALVGVRSGRGVRVGTYADTPGPATSLAATSQMGPLMSALAGVQAGGRADLAGCLREMAVAVGAGQTIIISDLLEGDDLSQAIGRLVRPRREVCVIHLHTPCTLGTGSWRLVGAEGGTVDVELTDEAVRQYEQASADWRSRCRRECIGAGANYAEASIDWPLERLMLGELRWSGLLSG